MEKSTVVVVEDDQRLARLVRGFLCRHGFQVQVYYRGDDAISHIPIIAPDVVILDIGLPGADGFEVCRALRPDFDGLIVMLTARDDDIDQIVGLEIGADDYIVKPVEPRVLLARLRSLLRRQAQLNAPSLQAAERLSLTFGSLALHLDTRDVLLHQQTVSLTTTEFDLLAYLARHAGQVLARETLFKALRGLEYDGLDRSIDVGISRLRKKLNDSGETPRRIKTVRGKGYLFVPDSW
ncbi:MAG: winged helix-turn-helix domain-containing protein [Pseudomonadota bacterium]